MTDGRGKESTETGDRAGGVIGVAFAFLFGGEAEATVSARLALDEDERRAISHERSNRIARSFAVISARMSVRTRRRASYDSSNSSVRKQAGFGVRSDDFFVRCRYKAASVVDGTGYRSARAGGAA